MKGERSMDSLIEIIAGLIERKLGRTFDNEIRTSLSYKDTVYIVVYNFNEGRIVKIETSKGQPISDEIKKELEEIFNSAKTAAIIRKSAQPSQ